MASAAGQEYRPLSQSGGGRPSPDPSSPEGLRQSWLCRAAVPAACICGLAALAPLLLLAHGASISPGGPSEQPEAPVPQCLGFDECPPYPLPYEHGDWPTSYDVGNGLALPQGFVWGVGTSAYQIEGGYQEGGRGASIWDTYTGADTLGMPGANCSYCCNATPCPVNEGMRSKGASGNVACDHYHKWREHVALMKAMGAKHYRLSVSWPRILPTGRLEDGTSAEGIKFYSDLIDGLLDAGIEPFITLYHWDLPQGLLSPPSELGWWSFDPKTKQPTQQITQNFVDYASVCFENFGDRVKLWVTFNEPWTFLFLDGAPNRDPFKQNSSYIAAHNVLLAHAAAVQKYRLEFQESQGGAIGIAFNQDWQEPNTTEPQDVAAAERLILHQLGWFADPIFSGTGDYPAELRRLWGDLLPNFTEEQSQLVNGSADFFGINTYGTSWASNSKDNSSGWMGAYAASSAEGFVQGQSAWLHGAAWGIRKLVNWIYRRYQSPPIYVTESGWSIEAASPETGVWDAQRLAYYLNYTSEVQRAISLDGVDVRGYFAWSLLDNFEWTMGYTERFGVNYMDYEMGYDPNVSVNKSHQPTTNSTIYRKQSSCWLEATWAANAVVGLDNPTFKRCNASLGAEFVAS